MAVQFSTSSDIRSLLTKPYGAVQPHFFHEITSSLCGWIGAIAVLIGELTDNNEVRTISVWGQSGQEENFTYALAGTPCASVFQSGVCVHKDGVAGKFPEDDILVQMKAEGYVGVPLRDENGDTFGILAAVTPVPLEMTDSAILVFEMLAARAVAGIKQKYSTDVLQALYQSTVGYRGKEFFKNACTALNELLQMDVVLISEFMENGMAITHGMIRDGAFVDEYRYELAGSPCEKVQNNEYCLYPERVTDLFPMDFGLIKMNAQGYVGVPLKSQEGEVIGVLCGISRRRLSIPYNTRQILEMVGARASVEIERQRAEEQLRRSLVEKNILLKELHHRVKNNMQVVCSMLDFQADVVEDEQVEALLLDSRNRIAVMARIHEKLYQTETFTHVNFQEYVPALVESVIESYSGKSVQVEYDIEDFPLGLDESLSIGLVVNELVSNAMKHAFPGRSEGLITVSLVLDKGDFILSIADDGIGFGKDFDLCKLTSLGLLLVQQLCEQSGGTFFCENNNGALFRLRIPIRKEEKA